MAAPLPPSPADAWLQRRFAEYYRGHPPPVPDRFGRREYGFLFFGQKFMLRHVGFAAKTDFEAFHVRNGPAHSYYSTAFYEHPDAPKMQEKGWRGAELIFDLDADHVPGAEKLDYARQLAHVKSYFVRLVDDFIRSDFGFAEKDLLLTFSGGRGYHCHVLAEKALELSSPERREIVDYVTGTGLQVDRFLWKEARSRGDSKFAKTVSLLKVAQAESPGWGGRLNRSLREYVTRLRALPRDALVAELSGIKGIGKKGLESLLDELPAIRVERIGEGFADQGDAVRKLIPLVIENQIVPLGKGETDEPVTSDTKRLIRTPGSLHGKSGLRVVTLTRAELDAFDPLVDAVAFGDEPVAIEVSKPLTVPLLGQSLQLDVGRMTVPEWAAVFAMMRGVALPADPT